ncbi:MAG: hypothetical protein HYY06_12320 [Deltaproteobacteria bacterium]|nr:hypothetical protein [Deltaproteobacteria bacterium]
MALSSGFRFEERMAGRYHLLATPSDEREMEFTLTARAPSIASFLRRPVATMEGEADLQGFADHKPARGTMLISPLVKRVIGYDFEFKGNDGETYRFQGQKDVELSRLQSSMSRLPASIFDSKGAEVGRAVVHFHYRADLFRFLRSWRLD